jgi:hypothetical protein
MSRLEATRREVGAGALALGVLVGCASYGSHLTSSPVQPGKNSVLLAADALVIDRGVGPQVLPNPELGLRFGIAPRVDVGGRMNLGSVETNARWRFLDGPAFGLALVPGLGFGFVPVTNADTGLFNAHVLGSLIAGVAIAERTELVAGARGASTYAFPLTTFRGDPAGARWLHAGGGVLGVRFPVGRATYLFPEVNVLVPYDTGPADWYFPTLQGGVALEFE